VLVLLSICEEGDAVTLRWSAWLWAGKRELLCSCKLLSDDVHFDPDFAPPLIIMELWKRLKKNYKLRIVKG